jgi:hypothetical protein
MKISLFLLLYFTKIKYNCTFAISLKIVRNYPVLVVGEIMSCFIFLEIRPLPLPSPKERAIELRVDKVLFKIVGHYLFPIT